MVQFVKAIFVNFIELWVRNKTLNSIDQTSIIILIEGLHLKQLAQLPAEKRISIKVHMEQHKTFTLSLKIEK